MQGKVVLITGASSGIGAGTAELFASKGCRLALTGRSEEGLSNTQKACIQAGAKEDEILLIAADLQAQESWSDIVDKTIAKFGKLDVLVNNAGIIVTQPFDQVTPENYDTMMDTNVKAVFFLTQKAMPHLIESKGNVVNVSSTLAQRPYGFSAPYNMSKAAIDHFTRIAALDFASKGVRVNAINPGAVKTQMVTRSGFDVNAFDEIVKKLNALGKSPKVEEMAKAIVFLADDDSASFITGVTLLVDGGETLRGPV